MKIRENPRPCAENSRLSPKLTSDGQLLRTKSVEIRKKNFLGTNVFALVCAKSLRILKIFDKIADYAQTPVFQVDKIQILWEKYIFQILNLCYVCTILAKIKKSVFKILHDTKIAVFCGIFHRLSIFLSMQRIISIINLCYVCTILVKIKKSVLKMLHDTKIAVFCEIS